MSTRILPQDTHTALEDFADSVPPAWAVNGAGAVSAVADPDELLRRHGVNGAQPHSLAHAEAEGVAGAEDAPDAEDVPNRFNAWTPVSVADYAAQPLPARRWLVAGLLAIHGVSVFHGMPGSLKTQIVLDGASCVACGCDWLPQLDAGGGYTFATTRVPVL